MAVSGVKITDEQQLQGVAGDDIIPIIDSSELNLDKKNKYVEVDDLLASVAGDGTANFTDWNSGTTYETANKPLYVSHAGNVWEFVSGTDDTGTEPGTDSNVWKLSSVGQFTHEQNTDTKLAKNTSDEVTASEIRSHLDSVSGAVNLQTKKISLTSTQILNLNSSPVELIATPGVGKFISVQIIYSKFNFNSSAYSSNTDLQFVYNGATTELLQNTAILASTGNSVETPFFNNNSDISPFENVSLLATNLTGDPTGGDGTVDIYITYAIIDT